MYKHGFDKNWSFYIKSGVIVKESCNPKLIVILRNWSLWAWNYRRWWSAIYPRPGIPGAISRRRRPGVCRPFLRPPVAHPKSTRHSPIPRTSPQRGHANRIRRRAATRRHFASFRPTDTGSPTCRHASCVSSPTYQVGSPKILVCSR